MGFNYLKVHAVMYHPLLCLGQTFSPENNDVTVYKFRESWLPGSLAGKKPNTKPPFTEKECQKCNLSPI